MHHECVRVCLCVCVCGTQAKMKGKNKPSRRHRKKQVNIIEVKKPTIKQKIQEEVSAHMHK